MDMRFARLACCVVLGWVACATARVAHAGTVELKLVDVDPSLIMNIKLSSPGPVDAYAYVGQLNWTRISGDISNPLGTYCIEITQDVHLQGSYTYTTGSLTQAASISATADPAATAAKLSELWGRYHDGIGADDVKGAAFQLAIWNIVYDTDLSLTAGTLKTSASASTQLAESWLGTLNGSGPHANLTALLSPTAQDQVYATPVPLPSSVAGAGALLAGVGLLKLRRRATATA